MKKEAKRKLSDMISQVDKSSEHEILQELRSLQMNAIENFRIINERISFPALKVVLLQGLTQSKAFWEEISQLLLVNLGEEKVLNVIRKDGKVNSPLTELEKQDMATVVKHIKMFEENIISTYELALEKPISDETKNILKLQLDQLNTRYQSLDVLERKLISE